MSTRPVIALVIALTLSACDKTEEIAAPAVKQAQEAAGAAAYTASDVTPPSSAVSPTGQSRESPPTTAPKGG